jgi:prevent-host-death family protein
VITTDRGFRQTLEQLQRAYEALAVLRQDVEPSSVSWYNLMAEGPLDQIRQLHREIDDYLQVPEVKRAAATTVSLSEAQQRLPDLLARSAAGEDVVIMQEGNGAFRLVPLSAAPASANGK